MVKNERVEDRYNRQQLIDGWNQEKLANSRVVLVGAGNLSGFTALSLAALGIGNLEIYDSGKVSRKQDNILFFSQDYQPRALALEELLKKINPNPKIKGINISFENQQMLPMMGRPNIIIDLTNSLKSKENILRYAEPGKINFVSAVANEFASQLQVIRASVAS